VDAHTPAKQKPADQIAAGEDQPRPLDEPRRDLLADPRLQCPVIGLVLLIIVWAARGC
jgi:hypothetical protein